MIKKRISRKKFLGLSALAGASLVSPFWLRGVLHAAVGQRGKPAANEFDDDSTAEEVTRGLDLSGKTFLVTGCNSGLGLETMRVLALRGARVLGAARNRAKAERAIQSLGKLKGEMIPVVCELTDYAGIKKLTDWVNQQDYGLDAVICNAGIMLLPELRVSNGLEKQFDVNYMGHFLLAQNLRPALEKISGGGRIVMVSSGYHTRAPEEKGVDFGNLAGQKYYDSSEAYGRSKLAMALYARQFSLKYPESKITANSLHPGVIHTNLVRHMPWYMKVGAWLLGWTFMKSVEEGAATQTYLATHPEVEGVSGYYYSDCNATTPDGPHFENEQLRERLWQFSENHLKDYLNP